MDSNSEHHNPPQTGREISKNKRILEGRRSFFLWLVAVGTAVMGAVLAIPVIRYVLYPVFAITTSRSWSPLGDFSDYASVTTRDRKYAVTKQVDGWRESIAKKPVYVVKGKRKPSIKTIGRCLPPSVPTWAVMFRGFQPRTSFIVLATAVSLLRMGHSSAVRLNEEWIRCPLRLKTAN